jgi:hypothetical protein
MHLGWARPIVEQCKAAGTKLFVKQLGARPVRETKDDRLWNIGISRKGGNPADWPVSLWVGSTEMNVAILPAIAIHPDVERWAIKTSVPAGAYTKNAAWVGLAGGLREGSRVWTTGHLTLAAPEPDGDFHLQLALEPGATEVFIVETTNSTSTTLTWEIRRAARAARSRRRCGRSIR